MSDTFKQFLFFLTFPENKRKVFTEIQSGLSEQEIDRWDVIQFERKNYCKIPTKGYYKRGEQNKLFSGI